MGGTTRHSVAIEVQASWGRGQHSVSLLPHQKLQESYMEGTRAYILKKEGKPAVDVSPTVSAGMGHSHGQSRPKAPVLLKRPRPKGAG